VCNDDIGRCHDVLESISSRDISAFLTVAAGYQNRLVEQVGHLREWSVRLYEHALVHGDLKLLRDFSDAFFFRFPAAIGEENEGYALLLEV
jgi:hypothetical protein